MKVFSFRLKAISLATHSSLAQDAGKIRKYKISLSTPKFFLHEKTKIITADTRKPAAVPLARVLGWKKAAYVSSRMGHLLVLVEGADVKFTKGLVCSTYVVYLYVPSIYLSRIYSKIVHLPDAPSPVRASLRLSSLVSFFSFLSLFLCLRQLRNGIHMYVHACACLYL